MTRKKVPDKFHITIALISLFLVSAFILQNSQVVSIHFLFWKLEMSRVIFLLLTLSAGFILGYIYRGMRKK